MREARNHRAPSCYASKMHSESSRLSPPTHDSLRSPLKAEGLSAVSASDMYHLCGSINSAALREKSDNQAPARKIRRFRVTRHNDFPLKTKPIKPFVPVPRTQVLCPLWGEGM